MKNRGRKCYLCGSREGNKRRVRIGIEERWVCLDCYRKTIRREPPINMKEVIGR